MCLLVNQPASTIFTEDFIADVYNKNEDGFGVMYAEGGKVHVYKCLPTDAKDMYAFYQAHAEGRDCVWHARMKTHGDIDMDNCHPYRVTDDIWMAHNGVLSSGNAADPSKSDTWHFIRNVLQPALTANPDLIIDEDWQRFIGNVIGGSNKFAFVRSDGEIAVINEKSGVNFVGAWLSNTYAWSTTKFGFRSSYQSQSGYTDLYGSGNNAYNSYWKSKAYQEDEDDGFGIVGKRYSRQEEKEDQAAAGIISKEELIQYTPQEIKPMIRAAYNVWYRNGIAGIENWIKAAPYKAAAIINYWYDDIGEGYDLEEMVMQQPDEAAVWIEDLFRSDSVQPSMLS